jgi:GT2 family glycosyltransferase
MENFNYVHVIVTFNREKKVGNAVDSLLNQTIAPKKIVVFDNASTDDTNLIFQGENSKYKSNERVHYVRSTTNLGGSGGFTEGIKIAQTFKPDWISLSDDDAYLDTHYIEHIAEKAATDSNIGVLTGNMYKLANGEIEYHGRGNFDNRTTLHVSYPTDKDLEKDFKISMFSFVGPVIRADVFEKVGLPRSEFFIHFDDIEFAARIMFAGYTAWNVAQSVIRHDDEYTKLASGKGMMKDWKYYYHTRNRYRSILDDGQGSMLKKLAFMFAVNGKVTFDALTQASYAGVRGYRLRQVWLGMFDAFNNKLGVRQEYLPGK